jgi:hypothetical protein
MIVYPNIQGALRDLAANGIFTVCGSGAPTNGTTGAGITGPGSTYIDTATGINYTNKGTLASPNWHAVTTA